MGDISIIQFKWRAEEMFPVQVIPFDEWPDEFFPTNCWGVVYIMSQFVRNKLIQVKIWAVQWLLTFANECCL